MTLRQETLLVRLWRRWSVGKPYTNQTVISFFFEAVRKQPALASCNAFEVFDSITNANPQG